MTEAREDRVRKAFADQAAWCARMGSPFTALLCAVIGGRMDRTTALGRRVLDWPGDPDGWADGLPLRLCGGLHALVRRGDAPELIACYPPHILPDADTLWTSLCATFAEYGAALLPWLDSPPQTNEVGRATALMSGLLVFAASFPQPIDLLELGASAGLNLNLDLYGYDLGGTQAGDSCSPLQLKPDWTGPPPPAAPVRIRSRRGVDLNPVDPVRDREKLLAYVWADQGRRIDQLEKALAVAERHPPQVDRGDAADWLEAHLPVNGVIGTARIVMHSIAYQYFPAAVQQRVSACIAQAGAAATDDAPLGWLRFEKDVGGKQIELRLMLFPGGEDRLLAHCQAHGSAIDWLS